MCITNRDKRSPPAGLEVGSRVQVLVAPGIAGVVSRIEQGVNELEVLINNVPTWGTVRVGARDTRIIKDFDKRM